MITPIKGSYCDVLFDERKRVLMRTQWRSNIIVRKCDELLADLLSCRPDRSGIQFWAIGEGKDEWDNKHQSPSINQDKLVCEKDRKPTIVNGSDLYTVEIEASFTGPEGSYWSLREFGLFGGNATNEPESGYLIDYVIHPRIDLAYNNTLTRRLRFKFNTSGASPSPQSTATSSTFENLPVRSIDGIGAHYTDELDTYGIRTIKDLVEKIPKAPDFTIPTGKLDEFRAKAKIVLQQKSKLDRQQYETFKDRNLMKLIKETSQNLSKDSDLSIETVEHLKDTLNVLRIVLDDALLKSIKLGDLLE